nr:probable protein phosphatase 2C 51 [Tanacetum cinerariifolium]
MMINKMDHTISTPSSLTNCRQTANYSSKLDVILARRKRVELRRSKVLSGGENDTLAKQRRFENIDNEFPYQSSVIGRRREMEDTISVELGFVDKSGMKLDFYGVYDGHGGSRVANACRERLFKLLASEIADGGEGEMDWDKLMVESFVKMDEEVNESEFVGSMGSTAVVAVVSDDEIVVANCGDSRAVLACGGVAVPLSNDHKPDRPDELERIEHSGGRVVNWNGNRVLGVLATSRSIGDRQLKPYVIAKPEVIVNKRNDKDEFMILASDGLWDVMSNDFASHVVRKCLDGRICRRRSSEQAAYVMHLNSASADNLGLRMMPRLSLENDMSLR